MSETKKPGTVRIIASIGTLITALAMVAFTILGVVIGNWALILSCLTLALITGYFLYNDYYYFFGKKS